MKEKELRLALVCYGGVSLAVYEHGVTKELLKLVRASRAYHGPRTADGRQAAGHTYAAAAGEDHDSSTEPAYFDFLKAIGCVLDLRVVVDVVAGSSAGGLNSVALAQALANDLSLAPLTDMWLEEADIERLLAPDAKAGRWSKWYFRPLVAPLLWGLRREGLAPSAMDPETRQSLSVFLRSRWFKPPLDGPRLTGLLLDALHAMTDGRSRAGSLLPDGQRLDLLVTVTDFHGAERAIFTHDPPVVRDREHRHLLRFSYERTPGGAAESDFGPDGLPALAFAGRATASYPGAFPPVRLAEIDAALAARGEAWPGRQRFLDMNFRHYREQGADPARAILLDGSILNNKPLFAALEAIRAHPAFREVDRRLVYVDPRPARLQARRGDGAPGFFRTLRGALSDLPRHEPIYQELIELDELNAHIDRIRAALEAARPQASALVARLTRGRLAGRVRPQDLRRWRLQSGALTIGLVYNTWITLMLDEAMDYLAGLLAQLCGHPRRSPEARWLRALVAAWARAQGVYRETYAVPADVGAEAQLPAFGAFIVDFGVKYRRRRLTFVIQAVNDLYGQPGLESHALDLLKRQVYRCLEALRVYDAPDFLGEDCMAGVRSLFPAAGGPGAAAWPAPEAFLDAHRAEVDAVFAQLRRRCDLVAANEEVDEVLASPLVHDLGPEARKAVLLAYVGFVYWDIVLLPMSMGLPLNPGALDRVLVDRISPEDAAAIPLAAEGPALMGASFAGFGGFLSRTSRENDYLWGRLHAVDRLFDLVASSVEAEVRRCSVDVRAFKKRAFQIVLETEEKRLARIGPLIARLKAAVAEM